MKMKYIGIRTALLCLSLGLMAFACDGWQYRQERGHRRVLVAENEVHDGWFFGGGDQVVVEGTINGDAYVAGGTVEIDGTINGDLIAAVCVVMKSFPGQTEDNALVRAAPIVKEIQGHFQTLADLID